jgi:hypothetical protein
MSNSAGCRLFHIGFEILTSGKGAREWAIRAGTLTFLLIVAARLSFFSLWIPASACAILRGLDFTGGRYTWHAILKF